MNEGITLYILFMCVCVCVCVSVVLVIQHAKRLRRVICHLCPVRVFHIFPH
jgi:hypothetical protein